MKPLFLPLDRISSLFRNDCCFYHCLLLLCINSSAIGGALATT
uniref:Uncharacterized protein n=1 Tax=Picea glauca TaxID=3330 RepID=A0A101LZL3_PICGL|nr:hypothetical protein ABT39_MTgene5301 [Picea glauca]